MNKSQRNIPKNGVIFHRGSIDELELKRLISWLPPNFEGDIVILGNYNGTDPLRNIAHDITIKLPVNIWVEGNLYSGDFFTAGSLYVRNIAIANDLKIAGDYVCRETTCDKIEVCGDAIGAYLDCESGYVAGNMNPDIEIIAYDNFNIGTNH